MIEAQFRFTIELLKAYSAAALANAGELHKEARVLLSGEHRARAYFTAVAAIEETGKAFLAFDGQGRNLGDSAVTAKLRRALENHSHKITAAFTPILLASPDLRQSIMPLIDLMLQVKRGREPSMYTDINYETGKVLRPNVVVREVAAMDCVRLAGDCLAAARRHVSENVPRKTSAADDAFFAMKASESHKIMNTEGFWWFYIEQFNADAKNFSEAIVRFRREHQTKGRTYERSKGQD